MPAFATLLVNTDDRGQEWSAPSAGPIRRTIHWTIVGSDLELRGNLPAKAESNPKS
jgi:hypothetical protein